MHSIEALRNKINNIDARIIENLAEREALIKQIGLLKHAQKKEITDLEQETKQHAFYKQCCEQHQLNYGFVKRVFNLMMTHSRQQQKKLFKQNATPKY